MIFIKKLLNDNCPTSPPWDCVAMYTRDRISISIFKIDTWSSISLKDLFFPLNIFLSYNSIDVYNKYIMNIITSLPIGGRPAQAFFRYLSLQGSMANSYGSIPNRCFTRLRICIVIVIYYEI